ncbi:MAG: ABC transporter permease subunit [Eubacteriales bacterium]|nr:ABC transporter permease subunit [Eubacteriales bacterium]
MSTFSDLYVWELKKIWRRRITKIVLAVMVILSAVVIVGDVMFSNYEDDDTEVKGYAWFQQHAENSRSISGRLIDDDMLDDMRTAIDTSEQEAGKYEGLYEYLWGLYGDNDKAYASDAAGMYQERIDGVHRLWNFQCLTDGEKAYWEQKEAEISPYKWQYSDGLITILSSGSMLNMLLLFLLAICLPSVFAEEHTRKTDQLILCSRFGKQKLYGAKLLAGVTFGVISAVLLEVVCCALSLWLYGADGFDACMQMVGLECSWTMTVGQAVLMVLGLTLVLAVLYSVLSMFLVKLLKNSVAVLGIMVGVFFLCLIGQPPYALGWISRLYALLPPQALPDRFLTDDRLFYILGQYLTSWQMMFLVYPVAIVLMAWLGGKLYQRYQITGR